MHGVREGRYSSIPSQSMLADETTTNTSTLMESACLPIGCSVSAKYRGAFCSAQVKTVERQVKLKVILLHTGDTITISEEQIVQPAVLRLGSAVTIRLPSTSRHDTTAHLSRSGLAAIINASNNYEEKQARIKQIYDNSIYTVVFNDGDEKSLRRSSLCLQGIRLYQTQIGQQKLLDDIPTSTLTIESNDLTSIVAVRRSGTNNQHAFPALKLKRKSLADYMWIRSFLDGREYIVHRRDDVHSYKNNSDIQSLCRSTSKQATTACEKFIKYNQIPVIWQKKSKKSISNEQNHESQPINHDFNTSGTDVDDSDEETTEEKDSFVAQVFAFMDDRGTPINNIPKVHNYDLDLHRLFKIVRLLGGYNKVTKNDQWGKVYMKMGLPDQLSAKNNRLVENAYKKYLFAYEDLSKKLGTINASSVYFGARTSLSSDSRRSLIRIRQQSDDKNKSKQTSTSNKRPSIESKATSTPTKNRRRTVMMNKTRSSSASETSDNEDDADDDDETTSSSSFNNPKKMKKQQLTSVQKSKTSVKKPSASSEEKKRTSGNQKSSAAAAETNPEQIDEQANLALDTKSTTETDNDMKPVIKIAKISYELLKESTRTKHQLQKKNPFKVQHNTSIDQANNEISDQEQSKIIPSLSESIKQTRLHDLKSLPVTPVSPSPPPSTNEESPFLGTNVQNDNDSYIDMPVLEISPIFQTIIPSSLSITDQQANEIENHASNSNKRSYSEENSEYNYKIDEQLSPSKRSRQSISSLDSNETISSRKQSTTEIASINNRHTRLRYDDIVVNDLLLIKRVYNRKKQYYARCIEKNNDRKELRVHYEGLDSRYDEWIEIDRVIKRQNEADSNEEELNDHMSSSSISIEEKKRHIRENKTFLNDGDNGIWKSLELVSLNENNVVPCLSTTQTNGLNDLAFHSSKDSTRFQRTTSTTNNEDIITINIGATLESIDDNRDNDHIQKIISPRHLSLLTINSAESIHIEDISSASDILLHPLYIKEEIIDNSITNQQSTYSLIEPSLSSITLPNSPPENRRASTRQSKRRTFRDSSISTKKRTKLETDFNSNYTVDTILQNSDHIPIAIDQQSIEIKRCRTVGKRGGKRTVTQPDNDIEDYHVNSLVNITLRQQLEDMFENRTSRYNFLDLNNDVKGEARLVHLKDRMRQCQRVFINLKSALTKVEKQRKLFLRRQKSSMTQSTTNDLLLPSTCT